MNSLEKINIAILLVTITFVIAINDLLSNADQIDPGFRWFLTFLTSVGLFRMMILFTYWIIRSSDRILALYHGPRFLKGVWTYRYAIEGEDHVGIWRIEQDLSSISITGYGVDGDGRIDSHFRSISQLFEHQGVDEIMFARVDVESGDEHFSKTTLYVDRLGRRRRMSGPASIRAQSVLYGYEEAGVRHADITLRREDRGRSEMEIINQLLQRPGPQPDPAPVDVIETAAEAAPRSVDPSRRAMIA